MPGSVFRALASLILLGVAPAASAQSVPDSAHPQALCWTPRPAPRCHVLLVTNFGGYAAVSTYGSATVLLVEDVGLMVNLGRHAAVGATVLLTVDYSDGVTSGAALRYRRWSGDTRAWEVAVGVRGGQNADRGAVLGMLKYDLGPHWGVVARPELVWRCAETYYHMCAPTSSGTASRLRVAVGIELGSWPGLAVPASLFGIGAIAWAASPHHWM